MKRNYIRALVIALLVGIAVYIYQLVDKISTLDADSKKYADNAIIAIIAHWKFEELLAHATPKLCETSNCQQIKLVFDKLSSGLGPLSSYDGSRGEGMISVIWPQGVTISASYTATAKFKNGNIVIKIILLKVLGQWLVQYFHVDWKLNNFSTT